MSGDPQLGDQGWKPRWWVAGTTIITFLFGLWCAGAVILGVNDNSSTPAFCGLLIFGPVAALGFERLRK